MIGVAAGAAVESDAGLVSRAVEGDESAFATIVQRHHNDMVRVGYVVSGNLDIAEEAVASAWPIVWRRLASLREPDRLRPWLCSIAANEARQIARSRRRRTVREIAVTSDFGASTDPGERSVDIDLANALAGLSPDDRQLLALRYVAGLNSTELSRATRISPSGTRARLARLLDRLRKELGDE